MKKEIIKRVFMETDYMIKNNSTIRDVAKKFNISKSTVHKDLRDRLNELDKSMFNKIDKILNYHLETRHINGGISTKKKYLNRKNIYK